MSEPDILGRSEQGGPTGLLDAVLLKIVAWSLPADLSGRIRLTLPSGRSAVFGRAGGVDAALTLRNYAVIRKATRRGALGFADAYMAGDIDPRDLADVLRFFIDNRPRLVGASRGLFGVRLSDRLYHRSRRNTRAGSRRNIAAHYDLGNAFYQRWLDGGLAYSSGLYRTGVETLEDAQAEKNKAIIAALDLRPGHRLLEIGCGWGGLAELAGRAGAEVTAITVSAEQHAYASERIARAGLGDRVEIRFQDYRDTPGTFDRIASVEMIEAVGEEHWPRYFETLASRLSDDGIAVLQAITIREESFPHYRRKPDFIQRFVFPGGMLPTKTLMREHAEAVGLTCETVSTFGSSYARTLAEWRRRFEAAWPEIQALGFDERFRRLWHYYLVYCQVGFERGVIDVGHYRLTKRSDSRN